MLTQDNIVDIERVQKIALKVILNDRYEDYELACTIMMTKSLQRRRNEVSLHFELNCLKSPQNQYIFKERKSTYFTLRKIKSFEEPYCHSERYKSSPLPFLASLLNSYHSQKVV